jgi:phosphate transport system ATP-binding protein
VTSLSPVKMETQQLQVRFGSVDMVKGISLSIVTHEVLAIIGPSNSGKTSFLRSLNRMNEKIPGFAMTGKVFLDGEDIYSPRVEVEQLRRRVGMVFAMPVVLPMSIYENVVYGLRLKERISKQNLVDTVERVLADAYLWEEVKDRLHHPALTLSGGQQQRLCIARTLALSPEVILFDEPCASLDPVATAKVEEAIIRLKEKYTVVLVTNNTRQAARVGDRIAFFLMGKLIETGSSTTIFTAPSHPQTEAYITGKFG